MPIGIRVPSSRRRGPTAPGRCRGNEGMGVKGGKPLHSAAYGAKCRSPPFPGKWYRQA